MTARADRFVGRAAEVVRQVHSKPSRTQCVRYLLGLLKNDLDVLEWMQSLLSDINNQSDSADRFIDRSCIFKWANKTLPATVSDSSEITKYDVFYDEDRKSEYEDLNPSAPTSGEFQVFLSPRILAAILAKTGFLKSLKQPTATKSRKRSRPQTRVVEDLT